MFIDWYEWYWSESTYFLSTTLSFGWLSESCLGFSLFFYCQTAGWLALWQSAVGSSLLMPEIGVRLCHTPTANPPCHLVASFLLVCSQWEASSHCPTTPPPPKPAPLRSRSHFGIVPCCKARQDWCRKNKTPLINLSQHQSQKANNAVCL